VARGSIVLFTDADCVPTSPWIESMTAPFADPEIAAVKGSYRTRQQALVARFAQQEFEDRYDMLLKHSHIDMVDSYSAAFRKEVFMAAGGFDESFPKANNEDTELSYRLAASGCKMVFKPSAIVYHRHPATLSRYLRVKFWRGYWRMIVYRRYPQKAVADSYTPNVLKIQTMLMALSFFILPISFAIHSVFQWLLGLWAGVLISAMPFAVKAYFRDKSAGIVAPGIILLRSAVFAAGSLLGVSRSLIAIVSKKPSRG
jgi:cellulose synthase/poly-beta-1,6-N-acetylglucosamine synthase-like glycosyltransferase